MEITAFAKDFLRISELSKEQFEFLLSLAKKLKQELKETGKNKQVLAGKTLAMVFEKPSLRTRVSFEVGMTQLGGHAIFLSPQDIQLGVRESIADAAGTLCRMADGIMARVFQHTTLTELAQNATNVPVINGLSDLEHPCQILADVLTMQEKKGDTQGLSVAFLGDGGNNVTHSLALASGILGMDFRLANPAGYDILPSVLEVARQLAQKSGGKISVFNNPQKAAQGADVVYTDTWVSMGDEAEKEKRLAAFPPYQVTDELMKHAKPDAIFMHDMPAYRGKEVASSVIDGPQSVIFDQAENRLHAQKAVLATFLQRA